VDLVSLFQLFLLCWCAVGPNYKMPQVDGAKTVDGCRSLAEPKRPPLKRLTGGLRYKTGAQFTVARSAKQNLDLKLAFRTCTGKPRAAQASLVRVYFLPSTRGLRPPQTTKESSCSRAAEEICRSVPVEYNDFSGGCAAQGELDVLEEFVVSVQAATDDIVYRCGRE